MIRILICLVLAMPVLAYSQADSTAAPADTTPAAAKRDTVAAPGAQIRRDAQSADNLPVVAVNPNPDTIPAGIFEGMIQYRVRVRGLGTSVATVQRDLAQYLTQQTTWVRGNVLRMQSTGPLYNSTALYTANGKRYVLDSAARRAYDAGGWPKDLSIVRQTKRDSTAGHAVRLYHVVRKATAGAKPQIVQQLWVAEDLKLAPDSTGGYPYPKLPYLPLRIVTTTPKLETVVEATSVTRAPQLRDQFVIPVGWAIKPHDPLFPLGGMGGERNK